MQNQQREEIALDRRQAIRRNTTTETHLDYGNHDLACKSSVQSSPLIDWVVGGGGRGRGEGEGEGEGDINNDSAEILFQSSRPS